jgi:hypothetical protein
MIATGLAQEGIEIIRNARDTNWKDNKNGFESPFPVPNNTYCIDYINPFVQCSAITGGDALLRQDKTGPAAGLYSRTGSEPGRFRRTVRVDDADSGHSKNITSTVQWGIGISMHSVVLTDALTDWGDK